MEKVQSGLNLFKIIQKFPPSIYWIKFAPPIY